MATVEENQRRYIDAMHAMQSGVAAKMGIDPAETQPKHLRVGVNAAMVEFAALQRLLFAKGIITEEEFYAELADEAERERDRYQVWLRERTGANVTLG